MVNTKGWTIPAALIAARNDAELLRKHFSTPVSMTAGAEAAKEAVAAALLPASSTTRPGAFPDNWVSQVQRIAREAVKSPGAPPGGGRGAGKDRGRGAGKDRGRGAGRGAGRGGGRGAGRGNGGNKDFAGLAKDVKAKIHNSAMRAKKCVKFNKGQCAEKKCPWPHECSICDRTDCAALHHADELGSA